MSVDNPNDIGDLVGALVFLWFTISMFALLFKLTTPPKREHKIECPPHKYTYGTDGKLVCTTCSLKPSDSYRNDLDGR